MIIGIISDTHNLFREEVKKELKNCNKIIHAGDIGSYNIIKELEKIAPTEYVYGNCDKNMGKENTRIIEVENKKIYIIHNIKNINTRVKDADIIIYGHSHKLEIYKESNTIYINPGSIGPKRFNLPISMVKMYINEEEYNNKRHKMHKYEEVILEEIYF